MRLRYRRDLPLSHYGARFQTLRYPTHEVDRATAEQMRAAMPDPDAFEIVEED